LPGICVENISFPVLSFDLGSSVFCHLYNEMINLFFYGPVFFGHAQNIKQFLSLSLSACPHDKTVLHLSRGPAGKFLDVLSEAGL
jgi:hypothetical protein